VDASDPRKAFATEIFTTMRASLPRFSRNGTTAALNGDRSSSGWKKQANEGRENHAEEDKAREE